MDSLGWSPTENKEEGESWGTWGQQGIRRGREIPPLVCSAASLGTKRKGDKD